MTERTSVPDTEKKSIREVGGLGSFFYTKSAPVKQYVGCDVILQGSMSGSTPSSDTHLAHLREPRRPVQRWADPASKASSNPRTTTSRGSHGFHATFASCVDPFPDSSSCFLCCSSTVKSSRDNQTELVKTQIRIEGKPNHFPWPAKPHLNRPLPHQFNRLTSGLSTLHLPPRVSCFSLNHQHHVHLYCLCTCCLPCQRGSSWLLTRPKRVVLSRPRSDAPPLESPFVINIALHHLHSMNHFS